MRAAKHIAILVLALNMLGSTLLVPLIYLDFNLRRDYIARVLCINKKKPITVCNGKCYLRSQLQKAREHEDDKRTTSSEQRLDFSFFNDFSFREITFQDPFSLELVTHRTDLSSHLPDSFITDIFHPPRLELALRFN